MADGAFEAATIEVDRAISRAEREANTRNEWSVLNTLEVGYYMCAKAQLLALCGDLVNAEKMLRDAESYGATRQEFKGFLVESGWREILSATRGLIYEKAGRNGEAVTAYDSPTTSYGLAREALIALGRGSDAEAEQLARKAGDSPTAYHVLGRIAEKRGDKNSAADWYQKASAQLQKSTKSPPNSDNQFLPIYFCEGTAITEAQKRPNK